MKFTAMTKFTAVAVAFAGMALADTVPEGIAPSEPSPKGCKQTVEGNFTLGTLIIGDGLKKRESAQEAANNLLVCTLNKGILHDPQNRTGGIVANYQFQFDGPPQAGTIYTGGWSVCPNGTLALGGSTMFYRCQSGGFYNLYDRWIAAQCEPAHIMVTLSESTSSSSSSSAVASKTASAASVSGSASASASASTTDSASLSATGVATVNGTLASITSSLLSRASSASATLAPATSAGASGSTAPSSSSTGGAVPTRVPRRETFGAVIGILGAALII